MLYATYYRYLAHGSSRPFLSMVFKIGVSTVAKIALEKGVIVLHNYLKRNQHSYCEANFVDRYNGENVIDGH